MLLVASETGHVYTFATKKLQPMITSQAGKQLIQTCLNADTPAADASADACDEYADGSGTIEGVVSFDSDGQIQFSTAKDAADSHLFDDRNGCGNSTKRPRILSANKLNNIDSAKNSVPTMVQPAGNSFSFINGETGVEMLLGKDAPTFDPMIPDSQYQMDDSDDSCSEDGNEPSSSAVADEATSSLLGGCTLDVTSGGGIFANTPSHDQQTALANALLHNGLIKLQQDGRLTATSADSNLITGNTGGVSSANLMSNLVSNAQTLMYQVPQGVVYTTPSVSAASSSLHQSCNNNLLMNALSQQQQPQHEGDDPPPLPDNHGIQQPQFITIPVPFSLHQMANNSFQQQQDTQIPINRTLQTN